ncbi:MAG: hypothetical protein ACI8RD_013116 [Bacillariaceae sp.]|jgi:hypothetical protein
MMDDRKQKEKRKRQWRRGIDDGTAKAAPQQKMEWLYRTVP